MCLLIISSLLIRTPENEWQLSRMEVLKVPFLRSPCRLAVGPDLELQGLPESDNAYVIGFGDTITRYAGFKSLKGMVRIDSPESALSYVRLRTFPVTACWWQHADGKPLGDWMEIYPAEDADVGYAFGDHNSPYNFVVDDGTYGLVSKSRLATIGYQLPIVTAVPGGYEIRRWVDDFDNGVGRSTEVLLEDGTYRAKFARCKHQPEIGFDIPQSE